MKLAAVSLILALGLLGGCTKDSKQDETGAQKQPGAASSSQPATQASAPSAASAASAAPAAAATSPSGSADLTTDTSGLSKAVVVVKTSRGTIKFRFYSKDAPNTVKRFVELTEQKFFNGLAFHRVVPGFVAQTGDPKSRNHASDKDIGTGGTGVRLKAEFNSRRHVKGTVAMARSADPDSADSQFYFCMNAFPHLDNNYTVFGQVIDYGEKVGGEDVLERIHQGDEIVEMHIE